MLTTTKRLPSSEDAIMVLREYAKKQSYDMYVYFTPLDTSRTLCWNTIQALTSVLKQKEHDWIVWLSDETFITNQNINIAKLIEQYAQTSHCLLSGNKRVLNSSCEIDDRMMIVKNSYWIRGFLETLWELGENSRYNQEQVGLVKALVDLINNSNDKDFITILPAGVMQSFLVISDKKETSDVGSWKPGDFAATFQGSSEVLRKYTFQQLYDNPFIYPHLPVIGDKQYLFS